MDHRSPHPDPSSSTAFIGIPRSEITNRRFSLTEALDDPSEVVARHTHDAPHFCLVLSEGYRTSARGASDSCGRGTVLYHPAGTVHEDHFERRGGTFLVLSPTDNRHDELDHLPDSSRAYFGPRIELLCERVNVESRRAGECSRFALESLYFELLAVASDTHPSRFRPAWIAPTLEWIHESRAIPTVEELARFAGVHPVSFARTFRRHVGLSPGEFLQWTRIQRVLPAVRSTTRSLVHLALDAGFSDQSAFTRTCRRVLGVPPGEYRRSMRG